MPEEPLCTYFMDTTLHETELCTFLTIQTFMSEKLCSLCLMHEFWHSSITAPPYCFKSSVHRALNKTENVLFGVCFAFLMFFHTEVENCMT